MLPLKEKRQVAKGTMSFAFELGGPAFAFKPGQFVRITLSDPPYQDEKGNARNFSIASSPRDPFILIATRMTGSAFKRSLAEIPLGSAVHVEGPYGSFLLHGDPAKPAAFFAGGIGVTPFRSMIKNLTEEKLPYRLVLIYSNRTPESAAFLQELQGWARKNPRLRLIVTMTQPEKSEIGWSKQRGYVDAAFVKAHLDDLRRFIHYVAGPPGFVAGVSRSLLEAGAREEDIRREEFEGYE